MKKKYLIIYVNDWDDVFKTTIDYFTSKKEALKYFKEHNIKYGYKVIAIREVTSSNIYL